jgi:hypothetical protein
LSLYALYIVVFGLIVLNRYLLGLFSLVAIDICSTVFVGFNNEWFEFTTGQKMKRKGSEKGDCSVGFLGLLFFSLFCKHYLFSHVLEMITGCFSRKYLCLALM